MSLTRRTLLQSLAALFPLTALGLGRAPTQSRPSAPRLPEPAGGGDDIWAADSSQWRSWSDGQGGGGGGFGEHGYPPVFAGGGGGGFSLADPQAAHEKLMETGVPPSVNGRYIGIVHPEKVELAKEMYGVMDRHAYERLPEW